MFTKVAPVAVTTGRVRSGVAAEIVETLKNSADGDSCFVPASVWSGKGQGAYHATAAYGFAIGVQGTINGKTPTESTDDMIIRMIREEAESEAAGNSYIVPDTYGFIVTRRPQTGAAAEKFAATHAK